eukprot:5440708-Prorocentrum_lima.AAC.1
MTSSLVGSEMCIRDSCRGACRAQRWFPFRARTSQGATESTAVDWVGPVSYTHLTLPTICSV